MKYTPNPIDTTHVTPSKEITKLTELLAKNTHDNWARQRFGEGWRYGPHRDDAQKEHPCLVPYEELPESEKQYDRSTALETIKAVLAMGYRIESPGRSPSAPVNTRPAGGKELELLQELLESSAGLDVGSLLDVWHSRNADQWSHIPELYRLLGERTLKLGQPLLAYDVLAEGLKCQPGDLRLRQLQALALARSGVSSRANAILVQLRREGHNDEETLGLLARTHKDLWALTPEPRGREHHLRLAYEFYSQAYRLTRGYWTGINAATLAVLLGQRDESVVLAREIREVCRQELKRVEETGGDRYWPLATLGEVALIVGEWSEAEDWYLKAGQVGHRRLGDLHSTRRNARQLIEVLGGDKERIERCFRIPRVVVFAGHMIDKPNRETPRFPPGLERVVHKAIRERLGTLDARLGYSSAACGSDILFLEAILELDGEAHVALPYGKKQFMQDSVETVPGAGWGPRYERVLQLATQVVAASEQRLEGGTISYDYANLFLYGLAKVRAEQLDTELVPMAVWDGRPGDGPGGTASLVARWRDLGHQVELVDLGNILQREYPGLATTPNVAATRLQTPASEASSGFATEILGIVFADAVGFSKLAEGQIPHFVGDFLGMIAQLLATLRNQPLMKNTWGDGLYFVFPSVRDAGVFALDLCDLLGSTNWAEKGLPEELSLRIAVHAGPIYSCIDPVTQQRNYIGTHVSRAARIEPITPPGQVYASQAFAALAAAERVRELTCEYVGETPLAKGYGTFPTYQVRRRSF